MPPTRRRRCFDDGIFDGGILAGSVLAGGVLSRPPFRLPSYTVSYDCTILVTWNRPSLVYPWFEEISKYHFIFERDFVYLWTIFFESNQSMYILSKQTYADVARFLEPFFSSYMSFEERHMTTIAYFDKPPGSNFANSPQKARPFLLILQNVFIYETT